MSLDTTQPPLPTNAAQEKSGNLEQLVALLQQGQFSDDDGTPLVTLSLTSIEMIEGMLRQVVLAALGPVGAPGPPINAAVGVNSAQVLQANPGRKGLTIANVSTNGQRVALALHGGAAVLDAGMVIWPQTWWWMDRYSFTLGPVFAIASAPSAAIAIQEFN